MAATMEYRYEALAQQSEALRIIFESLPWGLIVADLEGRLLFSNHAAERILGIGNVEVLPGTRVALEGWYLADQVSVVPPDHCPWFALFAEKRSSMSLFTYATRNRIPEFGSGSTAWPLKDSAGTVSAGVVMFHDFTQGRNALQSFVLLSRVVEQTADSVVLTDTQGIIQYVNPAFETTTGYSRDEALGKTPRILKSGLHDAEFYRQMWAQFTHGLAFKGMVINRKKTGELFWAQQTITSMRDESGHLTHFVSVSQDITELRKKQEQEFQLQLARDVQQRFYAAAPVVSGFDIGGSAHPADETGGDYFDSSSWRMALF